MRGFIPKNYMLKNRIIVMVKFNTAEGLKTSSIISDIAERGGIS